jgi:hypothetical protein
MLCIAYLFIYIYTSYIVIYRNIYIWYYKHTAHTFKNETHLHLHTMHHHAFAKGLEERMTLNRVRVLGAWKLGEVLIWKLWKLVKLPLEKKNHENTNSNQSPSINGWYGWFIVENTTKIWIMIGKHWLVVYLPSEKYEFVNGKDDIPYINIYYGK